MSSNCFNWVSLSSVSKTYPIPTLENSQRKTKVLSWTKLSHKDVMSAVATSLHVCSKRGCEAFHFFPHSNHFQKNETWRLSN
jgi:hypothetical protein